MIDNVGPLFRFLVAHYSITSITSVFKKFMNKGGGGSKVSSKLVSPSNFGMFQRLRAGF